MRRRQFIALFGGAAAGSFAAAAPALAQRPDKVPRVGILTPAQNGATPVLEALRKGLADFGYVDGKTIQLDFRFAKGNIDALRALAAELAQIPVDLIVTVIVLTTTGRIGSVEPLAMRSAGSEVSCVLFALAAANFGSAFGSGLDSTLGSGLLATAFGSGFDAGLVPILATATAFGSLAASGASASATIVAVRLVEANVIFALISSRILASRLPALLPPMTTATR